MAGTTKMSELTGWWMVLLKFLLAVFPVFACTFLPWCAWVTKETFANHSFREAGDRFTATDAERLRVQLLDRLQIKADRADVESIRSQMRTLPPQDWRDKINAMESTLKTVELSMKSLEVTMQHTNSMVQSNAVSIQTLIESGGHQHKTAPAKEMPE